MKVPLALLLACATGCRTTETRQVSSTPTPVVRFGTRERMWEVRAGDELVGRVVLFQEEGSVRDSVYFVRNPWHQDLGLIDGLGRAFRFLPHHEEPAWVGSGTVALGVQRILELEGPCRLIEATEPASAPRSIASGDGADAAPQGDASRPNDARAELPPASAAGTVRGGGFAQ